MTATMQAIHFPAESGTYRAVRAQLLEAEKGLRRQLEEVAALRRKLPLGGEIAQDYVFEEGGRNLDDSGPARQVRMSQLYGEGKDTLMLYSFMFGPTMKEACPSCTSILDGLNGTAPHVTQRVNFAAVARSPIQRIRAFARERGWHNLRLLSSAENSYNLDYHAEGPEGEQLPALNVFARRDGRIHHLYNTELLYHAPDPGQDQRHVDLIWPLWSLLDLTPEGRSKGWYPELAYART